jgi:ABC-type transport system involved in multi-copper enzyme maturation permease subunit
MWRHILNFELKLGLKKTSFIVYFLVFFSLAFLIVNILGGAFTGARIIIGNANNHLNAPLVIAELQTIISLIGVLICAAIFGNSGYRDFEFNTHSLFFTKPIKPSDYFLGRFSSSFILCIIIQCGFSLGLLLGFLMPYLDSDAFGPFNLYAYLHPFIVMVIPNIFMVGSLLFTIAVLTRRMLPTYMASVVLLFGYLSTGTFASDMETRWIATLIDPFGGEAISDATRYWTQVEQNENFIPLTKWLLLNRLLWIGIGGVFMGIGLWKFDFKHPNPGKVKKETKRLQEESNTVTKQRKYTSFTPVFNKMTLWLQFKTQVKIEIKRAFRDPYFIAIAGTAAGFLLLNQQSIGKMYGVNTLPITDMVINVLGGSFALFMLILITFYAGQIIWRERELKADQIMDSLPIPNWVPLVSKLMALILIPGIMLFILMIIGLGVQTWRGFYDYEVHLYLKQLFVLDWTNYALLCVLAFSIQVIVNHKYLGHFIMILYFLFGMFAGQLGLDHSLYDYGSGSGAPYSDMNGFEPYIWRLFWYKAYWISFAVLLVFVSNLFWSRGLTGAFKSRWIVGKKRMNGLIRNSMIGFSALFLGIGSFIFYNTNIINEYHPPKYWEERAAEYEKKYKKFKNIDQPKIIGVNGEVHLFPKESRLEYSGTYKMKNKTDEAIDTLHSNFNRNASFNTFSFSVPCDTVFTDNTYGWKMFVFDPPILPGEEFSIEFSGTRNRKGFSNNGVDRTVIENGTMIWSNELFPSFGYNPGRELSNKRTRKKYGLTEEQDPMLKFDDINGNKHGILGDDADWVDFEMILSTDPDQIAMTPGYLQKEWTEGERRFFHYKMDQKIHNLFAFVSARYEVLQEDFNGVSLEVYYHKSHNYNIDKLMDGMKKSIEYYSEIYGPYPYRQCRILEIPKYASYAASFPNTIPFSESIGFVMDIDPNDPEDLDMPFWVTAHEMGHQWWPHQVSGGNVQGAAFLSEGLSEYSAVSLLAKEKGEKQLRKFLKYELDKYLEGRAFEQKYEPSIIQAEGQSYIHYNKAGLTMYTLSDFIGKDIFNRALGNFIEKFRYKSDPYPNIGEFINSIRKETPDDLQYLITDTFEKITLYENKAKSASAFQNLDSTYTVNIEVEAKKVYSDSLGIQSDGELNDWLEIGVLGEKLVNGEMEEFPIYLEKVLITDSLNTFQINVKQKPIKAGIDPMHKFVDRDSEDNLVRVTMKNSEIKNSAK